MKTTGIHSMMTRTISCCVSITSITKGSCWDSQTFASHFAVNQGGEAEPVRISLLFPMGYRGLNWIYELLSQLIWFIFMFHWSSLAVYSQYHELQCRLRGPGPLPVVLWDHDSQARSPLINKLMVLASASWKGEVVTSHEYPTILAPVLVVIQLVVKEMWRGSTVEEHIDSHGCHFWSLNNHDSFYVWLSIYARGWATVISWAIICHCKAWQGDPFP